MNFNEKLARRIEKSDGQIKYQKLIDHIHGVSEFSEEFISKFFLENSGKVLALLHDLGKYSDEFQERIRGKNIKVDHSTAGAIICDDLESELKDKHESVIYKIFKYIIIGHHSGLLNYGTDIDDAGTISSRLNKKEELCDFSDWKDEISIDEIKQINMSKEVYRFFKDNFSIQMLIRFLFSSLVDGDRLDAQRFSEGENSIINSKKLMSLDEMTEKFNDFMELKKLDGTNNPINSIRNIIFNDCVNKSNGSKGFYSLCVPTGGGKTLSSLAFALNHAKQNGHDRIIYSLPFTSIIEQNAKVYSDIFGEENVLEHHCNFNFSNEIGENEYSEKQLKYKLATENWDMPLIVTTNVQLFESMYSNKPSSVRKLHNIYNSIIILDEAQVIPNEYLKPCIRALEELVKNYSCTVLFCTATQPGFKKNGLIENFDVVEIIDDTYKLFEDLKRVEGKFIGKQSVEEICNKMNSHKQVLTIVNTKKHAKEIFESLSESEGNFHLSTNMYPNHRKEIIRIIKERLKNGEECRVISTQLIEAGVDVDFPVVFRSVSGIDSIVQAAGRCNREGKRKESTVYVFKPEDSLHLGMGYLKLTSQIGEGIIEDFKDFLSIDAIDKYFSELFIDTDHRQDKHNILKIINKRKKFELKYDFEKINDEFKFIDNVGTQIIVPIGEGEKLLNVLKYSEKGIKSVLRKLNGFSINIADNVLKELIEGGCAEQFSDDIFVLKNLSMYDSKIGFDKDNIENYDYII
ncbi:CRISPR-associated helicase/endonuclease Cas3 [Candidatus Arthromitus sp. SFB-rat-Yit]|uniref:CRISPR-associated helicase/endonuclease Cas3 n=1 Tax=Candidatus Arthromitus sp. SFB-rat-Yit TaxID=1041504 RepID=UPI000227A759|nr:CRISPR-associated helicase/endonuclease Cas3 [Candidatus Arthromitus sp. SFB-rat-Yit]BAK81137.1 CRISPR-associated helicase Cas3 domain-containing protein [Candidatus Arthromitus sp. SFB-rat-Yit]